MSPQLTAEQRRYSFIITKKSNRLYVIILFVFLILAIATILSIVLTIKFTSSSTNTNENGNNGTDNLIKFATKSTKKPNYSANKPTNSLTNGPIYIAEIN